MASDHAQISTIEQINVQRELSNAGFTVGDGLGDGNDIALKRSYSSQITVKNRDKILIQQILEFLHEQAWCGLTFSKTGEKRCSIHGGYQCFK